MQKYIKCVGFLNYEIRHRRIDVGQILIRSKRTLLVEGLATLSHLMGFVFFFLQENIYNYCITFYKEANRWSGTKDVI